MADRLWTDKLPRYVSCHLGQLSVPSFWGRKIKYQRDWLGLGRVRSLVSGGKYNTVRSHMESDTS